MADKDIALAILQASVAIAGLVLVYSAFLITKAAEFEGSRRGDVFLRIARASLIPVLAALFCSGMGVRVLLPGHWASAWSGSWLIIVFEIVLAITAIYATIAAIFGT
jgi:hypothetical protein